MGRLVKVRLPYSTVGSVKWCSDHCKAVTCSQHQVCLCIMQHHEHTSVLDHHKDCRLNLL